jgi:hypothetical protein
LPYDLQATFHALFSGSDALAEEKLDAILNQMLTDVQANPSLARSVLADLGILLKMVLQCPLSHSEFKSPALRLINATANAVRASG